MTSLVGLRFGKLSVLSPAADSGSWLCICDCGNTKIAKEYFLVKGRIKSCGCKRKNFLNESYNKNRLDDLTGKKFGKLTVISRIIKKDSKGALWNCICDCGKNKIVPACSLKSGGTKSCGCLALSKIENLIGKKFGKLLVLSRSNKISNIGTLWDCQCECGNFTTASTHNLKNASKKSCGCSKKYADKTLSSKHALFYKYKKSAEKRECSFNINFETFLDLIRQNCYYCGEKPQQYFKAPESQRGFLYNGIDRIDSHGGYEDNNVVTCCKKCNYLKWNRNQKEFIVWIKKCVPILEKTI